jgi:HEAT repeat protein
MPPDPAKEGWSKNDPPANVPPRDRASLPDPSAETIRLLASSSEAEAEEAIWTLSVAGDKAVPLLEERLSVRPALVDEAQVRKLLKDLDADEIAIREQATSELAKLGGKVEARLREALKETPSPEVRVRIEGLLEARKPTVADRAIRALEQIGTEKARAALQRLK